MRSREWSDKLYNIAESQLGYFTASQARAAGVQQVRLVQLNQSGDIERVSRGVYRLMRFPLSPLGQYMEAVLWPQVRRPGARAVISHVSALALHELSEVSPAKIHITLTRPTRSLRSHARWSHFAPPAPDDIQVAEGVPVTTPVRHRDVHAAHLAIALAAGHRRGRSGRLTHVEADRSRKLLSRIGSAKETGTERRRMRPSNDEVRKRSGERGIGDRPKAKAANRTAAVGRRAGSIRARVRKEPWCQRRACPRMDLVHDSRRPSRTIEARP